MRPGFVGERGVQPLRQPVSQCEGAIGQNHRELVTPDAAQLIAVSQKHAVQGPRYRDQRRVTGAVAVRVVDGFEPVEIDDHHAQRPTAERVESRLPRHGPIEGTPVAEPGERIGLALLAGIVELPSELLHP